MKSDKRHLKNVLDRLYARYNHRVCIKPDPLQFVYRFSRPADMEIAGLLASCLAYGRVRQIENDLSELFDLIGSCPADFVCKFDEGRRRKLKSFKHRFTSGDDIANLLSLIKKVLLNFGSIEKFFLAGYRESQANTKEAVSSFCRRLLRDYASQNGGRVTKGLAYLLPNPEAGSACKRLNLYLRWMVRDDDVDAGIWKSVDTGKLIVPVDVHMGRLCRILGLYRRKTISFSAALEITGSFRIIRPDDPARYDFALSRIGIVEACNGDYRPQCSDCELLGICFPGRRTVKHVNRTAKSMSA